ncbi:MAG: S8 family serine peptidase [Anaerolineae bacterium]
MMRTGMQHLLICALLLGTVVLPLPSTDNVVRSSSEQVAQPLPAQPLAAAQISTTLRASLDQDERPDVLVLLTPQADLDRSRGPINREAQRRSIHETLWKTAADTQAPLRAWLDARHVAYRPFYIVNAILVQKADWDLVLALAGRPEVARVMTNPSVTMAFSPPLSAEVAQEAAATIPWGIQRIGAPDVWELGYRGQGVVVAGQDTGYNWDHPALQAQYRGWDGMSVSHDYNWHDAIHDAGSDCPPDGSEPCDDNGHGTHTMGTLVGDDGAGMQIGVAPDARWIGCRNMKEGVGTPATYAECFEFFLAPYPVGGTPAQGDPDKAPDIINNSWSCPPSEGCDAAHIAFLEQVVEAVRAAGIMVVASAGNGGPYCGTVDEPPGMYDVAYSVGATSDTGVIAGFSSRGTGTGLVKPDIVAPGIGVYSSIPAAPYYANSQGTSMAAPHVAGAVALIWSARPDLRGQITTTEELLSTTAVTRTSTECGDQPDAVPNSVYGWGRVDTLAAIRTLVGTLAGTVRNAEGLALEGALVQASTDIDRHWAGHSDDTGFYSLTPISGTFTVTASHPVYEGVTIPEVSVTAALTTTLDITLTVQVPLTYTRYLPLVVH